MKTQRKPRRLSIDSIITEMPVIEGELLRSIVGGYDNDCFWRCIAYIESGGTSYSEARAASYADDYFGAGNVEGRKDEAGMTTSDIRKYINSRYVNGGHEIPNGPQGIIVIDPTKTGQSFYGSSGHAVVYLGVEGGSMKVFDPQNNSSYTIQANAIIRSYRISNKTSEGNGSDAHGSNTSSGSSGVGVGSEGCYTPSGY